MQTTNEELRDRTIEITDLNAFMESILSSLEAAVIVLDRDLVVQVWTPQAQELWGLHHDEAVGRHLLDLDSGLPTADLHGWLRSVVGGQQTAIVGRSLRAVNRRGRTVDLRITVTALQGESEQPAGALVLMENVSKIDQTDIAER
jgi:two-component system, chemotaxis family, CheB/CheR fusion protein